MLSTFGSIREQPIKQADPETAEKEPMMASFRSTNMALRSMIAVNMKEKQPTHTDLPFCILFVVCMGCIAGIMTYAFNQGNPQKVYHGMDFEGSLCGVGGKSHQPYLFWCAMRGGGLNFNNPVTKLDTEHPICIEECPRSGAKLNTCYDPATGGGRLAPDYPTFRFAGRYCLPQQENAREWLTGEWGSHIIQRYLSEIIAGIRQGWPLVLVQLGCTFVACYFYLAAVECLVGCQFLRWIVILSLGSVGIGGLALGGVMIYEGANGDGMDHLPGSGDGSTDIGVGIVMCVFSTIVLSLIWFLIEKITLCVAVLHAANGFMVHAWSMFAEPLINFVIRAVVWIVMMFGFIWVISVGQVDTTKVYKKFDYTTEESIFIIFYIFMMFWINDICSACHEYVVGHATGRWYFTQHDRPEQGGMKAIEPCLLCKAYCSILFHLGSLCKGALMTTVFRPVRIILFPFVFLADKCGCGSCFFCTNFNYIMVKYSKIPFIEMGLSPDKNYQEAADTSFVFLTPEKEEERRRYFAQEQSRAVYQVYEWNSTGVAALNARGGKAGLGLPRTPRGGDPLTRNTIDKLQEQGLWEGCFSDTPWVANSKAYGRYKWTAAGALEMASNPDAGNPQGGFEVPRAVIEKLRATMKWERCITDRLVERVEAAQISPHGVVRFSEQPMSTHVRVSNSISETMGACWFFSFGGIIIVSGLAGCLMFAVVRLCAPWNDPLDTRYVEDPVLMAGMAAALGYLVATCFMMQYDLVVDAMLLCLAEDVHEMMTDNVQHTPIAEQPTKNLNMTMMERFQSLVTRNADVATKSKVKPTTMWATSPIADDSKRRDFCPMQLKVLFPEYFPWLYEQF